MKIDWENRRNVEDLWAAISSADGTDFRIYEPKPFNAKLYSHTFKCPGLRYEVGIRIRFGQIVWVHEPFPCGQYPDVTIF